MIELFRANCTSLTPRNALKWDVNDRGPDQWNFSGVDQIVDFAKSIRCGVYGHTLIWYRMPPWVAALTRSEDLRAAMRRRVTETVRHFNGAIYAWDVVNEPLEYDKAAWRDWPIQRQLGIDYIRDCFELAHQADPKAELVLNETLLERRGAIYDERRSMILDLVEQLRARSVPIHTIGLQSHARPGLEEIDPEAFGGFCAALKQMSVAVRITELDGSCRFVHTLKLNDPMAAYINYFRDIVRLAARNGNLKSVTTWGIGEKYAVNEPGGHANCRSPVLLYDDNLQPRPTLKALAEAIQGR